MTEKTLLVENPFSFETNAKKVLINFQLILMFILKNKICSTETVYPQAGKHGFGRETGNFSA